MQSRNDPDSGLCPSIDMLPECSSMQVRNALISVSQACGWPQLLLVLLWYKLLSMGAALAGGAWADSAGALDDPPVKKPPTAWPIEEPTATPLQREKTHG
ncbi:conserved hypothetical protein [Uncinocarpus reesii 1704]|uniref:Uncharacterized protein n=1 Tax=Uncinocarpus reesii (strain UAMH 1704) TaxID=336963 RepID=C4JE54_UNCRE|nr:uncharacterized protein UREG_00476 [Uncinocarpus reesii 1704]EEP75630.1 conserved hypothetical protein [Uncinocarpus reesii 1704]